MIHLGLKWVEIKNTSLYSLSTFFNAFKDFFSLFLLIGADLILCWVFINPFRLKLKTLNLSGYASLRSGEQWKFCSYRLKEANAEYVSQTSPKLNMYGKEFSTETVESLL